MSGKTVELESFNEAFKALNHYHSELELKVAELRKYASQCSELMENDTYSQRALSLLDEGLTRITDAVHDAKDIENRINKKIHEIEETENILQ